MAGILRNPTLYPKALTSSERDPSFKWHGHAHSPRSSQVFCISAFGTLRNLTVGNRVLASLLYEAFPEIATNGRPRKWTISGKTEWLWRVALAAGKPVFTLDNADNAHLIELCAKPIRENDTEHLRTGVCDEAARIALQTKRDITQIDLQRALNNMRPGNHSNDPRDWE